MKTNNLKELLSKITESPKGDLSYKDSVLNICQDVCGLDERTSECILKAVSKNNTFLLEAYEPLFINAVENVGLSVQESNAAWKIVVNSGARVG